MKITTFTLNRKAIRKALADYKQAVAQHEAIFADTEIQSLFESGDDEQANGLIKQRYPLGNFETREKFGIRLVELMITGIDEYKDIPARDIFYRYATFLKFLKLAEKV